MLHEGRAYAETLGEGRGGRHAGGPAMRFGAATGLRPLPAWKRTADFLFVQIGFSLDDPPAWRATAEMDVPVYASLIVIASASMAKSFTIPGLTVPDDLVARLETDRHARVDAPPVIWWSALRSQLPSTACTSFAWPATEGRGPPGEGAPTGSAGPPEPHRQSDIVAGWMQRG